MKKAEIAVGIVTIYLILFQALFFTRVSVEFIMALFLLSPFLVLAMVYVVLKHGEPSRYSFDERFYEDLDYERNGKENG